MVKILAVITLFVLFASASFAHASMATSMFEVTTAAQTCGEDPQVLLLSGTGHYRTQTKKDGTVLVSAFNWSGMKGSYTDLATGDEEEYNLINVQRVEFVMSEFATVIEEKFLIQLIGRGSLADSYTIVAATFVFHEDGTITVDVKKDETGCR
jgi:hypothetical protein